MWSEIQHIELGLPSNGSNESSNDKGFNDRHVAQVSAKSNDDMECIKATKSTDCISKSDTTLNKSAFTGAVFPLWSQFTNFVHECIKTFVVSLAVHAARNPKKYVIGIAVISFSLISAGFLTNFSINTDEQVIYAPFKSKPKSHAEWIDNESGFPGNARIFTMALHSDGKNILGAEQIRKALEAVDEVRDTPGYDELCSQGEYVDFDGIRTCKIEGVTRFFKHNSSQFEEIYQSGGEDAIITRISAEAYENDVPVDGSMVFGKAKRNGTTNMVNSTLTFNLYFFLPNVDETINLEASILERMQTLQEAWDNDDNMLKLEFFAIRSYSDEFARAIEEDFYLLPIVFMLMVGFTCLVFVRGDKVQSRSILGVASVITIIFSLMTSFGIMFLIGIPFTSMTQILPFVVIGVGLDDTFIITGAYFRTNPNKDPEERIRETMEEVGLSISVTTITTMFAFALGCISTIPAIYWLNLYAFPTICIDFLYQITFFVALLVLDERRVQANRRDCCLCITVKSDYNPEKGTNETSDNGTSATQSKSAKTTPERIMRWYANQLLRPWVKAIVILIFTSYAAWCAYCTTQLTQEFDLKDLLPADSYVKDFLDTMEAYSSRILGVGIYFRGDFDQLDEGIQQQMTKYVDELSALPQFSDEPPFCWFRDFQEFRNSSMAEEAAESIGVDLSTMTIQEQINLAFSVPAIQETYGRHVVFDDEGRITASRCFTYLENIDLNVVRQQIDLLKAQREITERQPINQGSDDWSFFTFERLYFIWEFYSVAIEELIFTTISGVVAVCVVGFFFNPHWGAIFFICPMICILYINLLGTLQFAGLYINAVTYICLVISIGLLVDFIVHVLLGYYESKELSREDKVKDTLETMGASIMLGGLTSFIGVIPLAFSTSEIMSTVFTAFLAMVILGVTHGIIFLPVLLSIFGPVNGGHLHDSSANELPEQAVNDNDDHDLCLEKEQEQSASDTDDSAGSVEKSQVDDHDIQRAIQSSSHPTTQPLHSTQTFREESLEVVLED